jgi:2-(1,2-epoxy-1,2-dihydrophenyl)acetyl-CoA isomerase
MSTPTEQDYIRYALEDDIATITLNRPQALNPMSDDLMAALSAALDRVVNDQSVRVLVLTGAGRGFCSGADLTTAAEPPSGDAGNQPDGETSDANSGALFLEVMRKITDCPVPTIARINGPAAGGGFGLALACDVTIAARSAFFVATFNTLLGIVPDMGVTWNVPRRVGRARALGITLLGERISAPQAEEWGLIWSAVADDELDTEVQRIAAILRSASPETVTRIRRSIDAAFDNSFSAQLDLEMDHQRVVIPKNMHLGAQAFLDKRQPVFPGHREQPPTKDTAE